jgi:hypothetical protein
MHEYASERPGMVKTIGRHLHSLGSEGVRHAGLIIGAVGIIGLAAGAAYGMQTEVSILKSAGLEAMHSYRDFTANLPAGTSANETVLFKDMSSVLRHYVGGWSDLPASGLKAAWAGAVTAVAGVGVLAANAIGNVFGRHHLDQNDYADDLRRLNVLVARAEAVDPAGLLSLREGGRQAEYAVAKSPWYERILKGGSKEVAEVARLSFKIDEADYAVRYRPTDSPLEQVSSFRDRAGLSVSLHAGQGEALKHGRSGLSL